MRYYTLQEESELNIINKIEDKEARIKQMELFAQKTNRNFDAVNSKLWYINNKKNKKPLKKSTLKFFKKVIEKPVENKVQNKLLIPVNNFKMFTENGFVVITF